MKVSFLILIILLLIILCSIIICYTMKALGANNIAGAKAHHYYSIMVKWIKNYQNGKKVKDYFEKYGYKSVSIYGMKEMGELLLDELIAEDVSVKYVVDRDESLLIKKEVMKYKPEDKLPDVDVMVITASFYFDEIKTKLRQQGLKCDVVSIDDVVYNLF